MDCQICFHSNDKKYTTRDASSLALRTINEKTRPHSNALNKSIWDSDDIYWRVDSKYPWINDKMMEKMIKNTFLEAGTLTRLRFQKRNRDTSDAHIVINWLGKKDDKYFTSPSILAYGWGPAPGLGGNITMNADVLWLLRKTPLTAIEAKALGYIENFSDPRNEIRYYDPIHTLKHEGGHALGMNHLTNLNLSKKAVMYPYYNGLKDFGDEDIAYIQSLYGNAGISKQILDLFKHRLGMI